ncbi:glycosyltransferase family 2 protein [Saprospiraceae bacterium]|nr:glycosyltransferase family 2 protein [Saprospiraceae bacterium]
MKTPTFSIILPTYNRRSLLPRAVESVLAQEYTNWELIIIDDGSTDETKEYVIGILNNKIQYHYHENIGRSASRNRGLEKSKGQYICFLDSDDELLPNYLSCFQHNLNNTLDKLFLSGVGLVGNKSVVKIIPSSNRSTCIVQCLEGYFNLMPFCFHKSLLLTHRFTESIYYGEDYKFLVPIIAHNQIAISNIVTSSVHQHSHRTINKVFDNISDGYEQFKNSVLKTLDNNFDSLSRYIASDKLIEIKKNKVGGYILAAAKYNFVGATKLNKQQNIIPISTFKLFIQRVKGIIQS